MEYIGRLARWEIERSSIRFEANQIYTILSRELKKPIFVRGREILNEVDKLESKTFYGRIIGPIAHIVSEEGK